MPLPDAGPATPVVDSHCHLDFPDFDGERDALIDEALEKRRMRLAISSAIATPTAKADGIGDVRSQRLAYMVTQVSSAFELKNPVKPEQVWNGSYLPPKADRMVFPK